MQAFHPCHRWRVSWLTVLSVRKQFCFYPGIIPKHSMYGNVWYIECLGLELIFFFPVHAVVEASLHLVLKPLGIRQFSQNDGLKITPWNHGLFQWILSMKYMKQVWENMGVTQNIGTPVCEALRMKFAGWRYSSTLIYYKKQIVRTMGPWSSNERLNSYPWRWFWGMMRHDQTCGYESWGCASRMKSPVYVVEFVFFWECSFDLSLLNAPILDKFRPRFHSSPVTFGIIIRFGGLHS